MTTMIDDETMMTDDAGWIGTKVTLEDGRHGVVVGVQDRPGAAMLFVRLDDGTEITIPDADTLKLVEEE